MPQLDFSVFPSQFFWLTISFFLMLAIFTWYIIPRTAEMINLRKNKIDEYLEKAEDLKVKVEKTITKYNVALEKATQQANLALQETNQEMDDLVENKQKSMAASLKLEIEQAEKKIGASRERALKKIDEMSVELAADALKKLGFGRIKANTVQKYISSAEK